MTDSLKRALIVEDSMLAGKMAGRKLTQNGCEFDLACDGATALEYFKKNAYDLILMDIGLPDMNGYIVAKNIRDLEKEGTYTPIFTLTAHLDQDSKKKTQDAKMDGALAKPLTTEQVQHMLDTLDQYTGQPVDIT